MRLNMVSIIQVLDENEQIIKLTYGTHVEYIKEGNITRLDSALSHALA